MEVEEVIEEHSCTQMGKEQPKIDEIDGIFSYGPCIHSIVKTAKYGWVAHCSEYASIINFCPFCGKKLD